MSDVLLKVDGLTTCFETSKGVVTAVDHVSFDIRRGETLAVLGESGCGKSMTAFSVMRLLPSVSAKIVSGSVVLNGQDLLQMSEAEMRNVRGNRIAMIFQEPMTSLNPVMKIGDQVAEAVTRHRGMKGDALFQRVIELFESVGIPDPQRRYHEYPHLLSGGMMQRVMIAMALAAEPDVLIADEPTTALDVTIQAQVLELMRDLQKKTGMSILLITHDLGVVAEMADRVVVMYAGQVVEQAESKAFFATPRHPYSQKLFESLPTIEKRDSALAVIKGTVPSLSQHFTGCRFSARCDFARDVCRRQSPELQDQSGLVRCHIYDKSIEGEWPLNVDSSVIEAEASDSDKNSDSTNQAGSPLLQVQGLKVHFPIHKGFLKRTVGHVFAVDGVDMSIAKGKTLALVGESGCGKTTVAKAVLQLSRMTAGSVLFNGTELTELSGEALRTARSDFQIIFQDPFSSLNPRMLVTDIIQEGMIALNIEKDRAKREQRVDELLTQVGLPLDAKQRYPHEFSGGQRQRVCIARALAVNPKLIICDEPTSALDISVQAQILNLLKKLQHEMGLSYLFITHNLSVVAYLADEVAVMYLGRIIEQGKVEDVLKNPQHPYTRALIAAIPNIDPGIKSDIERIEGDVPSPSSPPEGCHFRGRCPEAMPECSEAYPDFFGIKGDHIARCFLYKK